MEDKVSNKIKIVIVRGRSMEPLLIDNDYAYVISTDKYVVGDILVYRHNNETIIHRLLKIDKEKDAFLCKGDNTFEIEMINISEVIGKVVILYHRGEKRYVCAPNEEFINASIEVNKVYCNYKKSVTQTIRSEIYKKFIRERELLIRISSLQYNE